MTQSLVIFEDLRVLPQAWLHGLLYTYQSSLVRPSYLLGQYSNTGWWYYFPVAMLTKTPLATLSACVAAIVVLVLAIRTIRWRAVAASWTAACLFIPPAIFLISAMRTNLNLGLRHVLLVYPFIYLGIGLAVGEAWRRWRGVAKWTAALLAIVLALETLLAFPDYIAFFNAAAGGKRGGFRILGDSNLDWGQDLKLLAHVAAGAAAHASEREPLPRLLRLGRPVGVRHPLHQFPRRIQVRAEVSWRRDPGVLAISATTLQGIYLSGEDAPVMPEEYAQLLRDGADRGAGREHLSLSLAAVANSAARDAAHRRNNNVILSVLAKDLRCSNRRSQILRGYAQDDSFQCVDLLTATSSPRPSRRPCDGRRSA